MNNQGRKQTSELPATPKGPKGQFVKGYSGNPSGRPKGIKSKTVLMKEGMEADWLKFLREKDPNREERIARWEALMEKVYEKAMQGDNKALQLIMGEVHKDLRAMNQINAKADAGPRSVKININTKGPKEVGQVLDALPLEDDDGSTGEERSAEHAEDGEFGLQEGDGELSGRED